MSARIILQALALGFSAGSFCLGFCLPVALPILFGTKTSGVRTSAIRLITFLSGRLCAYLLIGIIAGSLGATLTHSLFLRIRLLPLLYILLALLLIIYGITEINPLARLAPCRFIQPAINSIWFLFPLGFLAGISPCPPFLLAITRVIDIAGIINGVLFFLFFFLATSLYLLPLLLAGFLTRFSLIRTAARILAILTGLYFLFLALRIV